LQNLNLKFDVMPISYT